MPGPVLDTNFDHYQTKLSTGRSYHYVDQRPENSEHAVTLLCIHGFPDLWYGWRNQIRLWVAEGYRVIVPDMLGYGKTDMPLEASAYSTKRLCDDLAALLDHLGVQKAVVMGHDWGSWIAGRFALWHPERLLALALLSIPYHPPTTQHVSVDDLVQRNPNFGYQVFFASEQSAAEIEAHLSRFFRLMFMTPANSAKFGFLRLGKLQKHLISEEEPDAILFDDKEFEYYIPNFERGMIGPLSYYRTTKVCFEEERALPSRLPPNLPVLTLYGTKDGTCSPVALENSQRFVDQLQVVSLPNIGHWIMLEAPQAVTEELLKWLKTTLGPLARTSTHL